MAVVDKPFNYSQLDGSTADFLRTKERNMREIVGRAYTELGRELSEARDRLAGNNQYDGMFDRWCGSLEFSKRTVINLIQRYETVRKLLPEQKVKFEDLPVTLSYQISSPTADSTPAKAQAKSEVLHGNIDTLKAYRERIAELERMAEDAEDRAERAERDYETIRNLPQPKAEVRTEYVEVESIPDDYDDVKQRLEEYRAKFGNLEDYDERITATHRQDMIVAVMSFSQNVREFIKRYSYMTKYCTVIENLDEVSRRQYNEAVAALKDMAESFDYISTGGTVIDAEYSEIL